MTRKIGDIEKLNQEVNAEEIRVINARRKATSRLVAGEIKPTNSMMRATLISIKNSKANEERMRDPLEQCKTYLRRKGYIPVATLPARGHIVGRREFRTDAELFEFAASRGWAQ